MVGPVDSRLSRAQLQRTLHRRRALLVALVVAALASAVLAVVARALPIWGPSWEPTSCS